ncbi:TRPM8 channel-associated factor homolog [Limulus polyphemus]|uniref:TRPM8 channel-associated factor homolog n=1 Tax=Limulus polyphemus TaxID=6850 RepID=A0ABM1B4B1_LIMPO|nr:TRPM8 channel-associated factor homolog [Limulus polyphemus]
MAQWREEILKGISSVRREGIPGTIVVWGDNAEPILTGQKEKDILIAAAEYGKGRVVLFTHTSYGNAFESNQSWFSQLRGNVINWLVKGQNPQNVKLIRVKGGTTFPVLKVNENIAIVHSSGRAESPSFFQKVENFVLSGGALFIAETPWGLMQITGMTTDSIPHYQFLKKVGLCFTNDYFSGDEQVKVQDNLASNAHLGRLMQQAQESQQKLQQEASRITSMITLIPKDLLTSVSNFQDFFVKCEQQIKQSPLPSPKTPISSRSSKDMLILYDLLLRVNGGKASGIEYFPGDFESPPFLTRATISLTSTLKDIHPTGYYLPAGQEMTVIVKNSDVQGWKLRIGCHSDNLTYINEAWRRWPSIMVEQALEQGETTISSPYGGLIYFESPDGKKSLNVELDSVVQSPLFDIKNPEANSLWQHRRFAPGLWADIVGEYVIVTLPSSAIRKLDYPTDAMTFWDQVLKAYHYLRGTDITLHRRQWAVPDEQPSAGYMHAGYPVVTHMDVADPNRQYFVLNTENNRSKGSWGYFHEFGHNMQRGEWSFEGTGEVTCNIFTLYAMDVVCNVPIWIHEWLKDQLGDIKRYLLAGANFNTWKGKAGVALGIYAQLAHCFGWDPYKNVFRKYETDTGSKPVTNEAKIDLWYTRFSNAANYNLAPLFEFWGFPLSASAKQSVSSLQPFICKDEMTSFAPDRFNKITSDYPNIFIMTFEIPNLSDSDTPRKYNGPRCLEV